MKPGGSGEFMETKRIPMSRHLASQELTDLPTSRDFKDLAQPQSTRPSIHPATLSRCVWKRRSGESQ